MLNIRWKIVSERNRTSKWKRNQMSEWMKITASSCLLGLNWLSFNVKSSYNSHQPHFVQQKTRDIENYTKFTDKLISVLQRWMGNHLRLQLQQQQCSRWIELNRNIETIIANLCSGCSKIFTFKPIWMKCIYPTRECTKLANHTHC